MVAASPSAARTVPEPTFVKASDGVCVAVYEHAGPAEDAETLILIHGYPDDHSVWDGVVAQLTSHYRVICYDVRGAGRSDRPSKRRSYRMEQLVRDFESVLDVVSPDQPVHLVAHDWGSIQAWPMVTEPRLEPRILSFTSISGPSLDMASLWLRALTKHPKAGLSQLLDSYYIFIFQVPRVPELLARRGVIARLVQHSSSKGRPAGSPTHTPAPADAAYGVQLYRANMLPRLLRPNPRETRVPVQVLAPVHDAHVSAPLQTQAPIDFAADLRTMEIPGNHWVVAQNPTMIAGLIREFVTEVTQP